MAEIRNICALFVFIIVTCNFTIFLLYTAWKGVCRIFRTCSLTGLNYRYIHILYLLPGILILGSGLHNYSNFMPKYQLYKSFYSAFIYFFSDQAFIYDLDYRRPNQHNPARKKPYSHLSQRTECQYCGSE